MSSLCLYLITVIVWGSTWLAIEFQLGVVAPEVSVFYRYAAASALLFLGCGFRRLRLRFSPRDHGTFALLGLCLFGLNFVFAYTAQQHISSAMSAIVFSTMLWMNIVNARLVFGTPVTARVIAGSCIGIAGVVVLFAPQISSAGGDASVGYGALLCVGGALMASFGNMVSQAAQRRRLPVMQTNAWGMFYGAVLTGALALLSGRRFVIDLSPAYLLSMAYLVVFGSILAFGAYLTLLGRIGAHRAAYAVVTFPVVAVILAVLFEGLTVDGQLLAGITLVLSGNVVTLGPKIVRPSPAAVEVRRAGAAP